MTASYVLSPSAFLYHADCREALRVLPDNSIDSVCTDPPYALVSIVKRFGGPNAAPAKGNDAYMRASAGFMGRSWDTGETAFSIEFWAQVLRVLKPGGHVAAFGATRGYHRMACAIEDAGFEIRDSLMWVYGSGFPKGQNVPKFIDKELGAKGTLGGPRSAAHAVMLEAGVARRGEKHKGWDRPWMDDPEAILAAQSIYIPASPEAQKYEGFSTALKPAFEPITVATKPVTVQQHFAILLEYLTDLLEEQAIWSDLNVHVAEASFSAIRAKLAVVTKPIVLDSARMRVLARFDPARCVDPNSIFRDPGYCVATKTKDDFAPLLAKPLSSAANYLVLTTQHGQADDLSTQLAAMCMSVVTAGISENTVSLWGNLSDAILTRANTFTIETASRLTIVLKTWNSLTSPSIIEGIGDLSLDIEPIVLARKPLSEKTVAANVLRWGTGALNIDGCRVGEAGGTAKGSKPQGEGNGIYGAGLHGKCDIVTLDAGRWPANVCHDGSAEVLEAFPDNRGGRFGKRGAGGQKEIYSPIAGTMETVGYGDSGSAARFFYSAKATRADRNGSKHPTVKPIKLMQWLARLITPPGGAVLDPFAGSGTTGAACALEGFNCVMVEREAEYVADIIARFTAPPLVPDTHTHTRAADLRSLRGRAGQTQT